MLFRRSPDTSVPARTTMNVVSDIVSPAVPDNLASCYASELEGLASYLDSDSFALKLAGPGGGEGERDPSALPANYVPQSSYAIDFVSCLDADWLAQMTLLPSMDHPPTPQESSFIDPSCLTSLPPSPPSSIPHSPFSTSYPDPEMAGAFSFLAANTNSNDSNLSGVFPIPPPIVAMESPLSSPEGNSLPPEYLFSDCTYLSSPSSLPQESPYLSPYLPQESPYLSSPLLCPQEPSPADTAYSFPSYPSTPLVPTLPTSPHTIPTSPSTLPTSSRTISSFPLGADSQNSCIVIRDLLVKAEIEESSPCLKDTPVVRKKSTASTPTGANTASKRKRQKLSKATRMQRKKDQNKLAALRYRQRKKGEFEEVDEKREELEVINADLKATVTSLTTEIAYLNRLWKEIRYRRGSSIGLGPQPC